MGLLFGSRQTQQPAKRLLQLITRPENSKHSSAAGSVSTTWANVCIGNADSRCQYHPLTPEDTAVTRQEFNPLIRWNVWRTKRNSFSFARATTIPWWLSPNNYYTIWEYLYTVGFTQNENSKQKLLFSSDMLRSRIVGQVIRVHWSDNKLAPNGVWAFDINVCLFAHLNGIKISLLI